MPRESKSWVGGESCPMRLLRVAYQEGRGVLAVISRVSVLLFLALYGCTPPAAERASQPLRADPAPQIRLAWTPPATMTDGTPAQDIAGYKLYYGFASRQYYFLKTLGLQTMYGLVGLVPERTYYVAVTAYNRTGVESGPSEELTIVAPPPARGIPTFMQEA